MSKKMSIKDKVLSEIEGIEYSISMEHHDIDIDKGIISKFNYQIKEKEISIQNTLEEIVFLNRMLEILEKLKDETDIIEVKCRLTDVEIEKAERIHAIIDVKLDRVGLVSLDSLAFGYAEKIQKDLTFKSQLNDKELNFAWKRIKEEI